jgi:hypothetical protein
LFGAEVFLGQSRPLAHYDSVTHRRAKGFSALAPAKADRQHFALDSTGPSGVRADRLRK